jgi:hypothetical protein
MVSMELDKLGGLFREKQHENIYGTFPALSRNCFVERLG